MVAKGFSHHDHDTCIASGLETARKACAEQGLQLTKVREKALAVLLAEHRAMGAYEVLEHLRDAGLGSQPPVAYRALDFLVKHGFVHRIEQLNAFIACAHPGENHAPIFLICRACSAVAEAPGIAARDAVRDAALAHGFKAERILIEVEGQCPQCLPQ
ncbi:Fur family transcriptional regulator [Pacificoceanicola onchidii]|uniref:Fur family transcriptional regulator n=1 Tax=Pacificoceanicola onchidii TaxID=2562685 RepID=UPI0010A68E3C|nr:Fur family transcriptional regulator [Pacificoceanicola onchidii]